MLVINFSLLYTYGTEKYEKTKTNKTIKKTKILFTPKYFNSLSFSKRKLNLLKYFLKDKFFNKLPPKSSGRDLFNLDWIKKGIKKNYSPEDIQRTLIELTATSIIDAIKKNCSGTNEIYLCGGGAKNVYLIEILKTKTNLSIKTTGDLNLPEQQVEAVAFAWLANQTLDKKFNNSPDVTGAKGFRVLGSIHQS